MLWKKFAECLRTDAMNTTEEIQAYIEQIAQSAFNKYAKPLIRKEMQKLKIKSIETVMGVIFFTMQNGETISDSDFQTTERRKEFVEKFIIPWHTNHFYTLINADVK
jgi:protoheme ferro-lyase